MVEFSKTKDLVEVVPQVRADLPFMLTGMSALWVESKQPAASVYHLHHPYNDKSFLAIEYINDQWYYLDWNLRKYYTKPLSYITIPISLSLGMCQAPTVNIALFSREPVEMASESMGMKESEHILKEEDELVLPEEQVQECEQLAEVFKFSTRRLPLLDQTPRMPLLLDLMRWTA